MGPAPVRRPQRPAPHHLHRRPGCARHHQGIRTGNGLAAGRRHRVEHHRAQHPVRRLQPVRRGDRRRLDRLCRRQQPEEAPGRGVPQRHQLLRGGLTRRRHQPASSHRGDRRLDRGYRTGAQPRPDTAGLVRRSRGRRDDDLGQLPRCRPEHEHRRDQRAPLRLLPERAPRRLHHRARVRAGSGRHPVGAADRRPARAHRTELGEGLDHRGQPDPRRQVLGHLDR